MNQEKTMISLEELIIYFLRKWKMIVAIMVSCIVLITGAVWLFFETKFVETDFLYSHYENLMHEAEEYQYNSPIMKIDYNEVHKKNIQLSNITNIKYLKEYILTEKIWDEFMTDTPKKFLPELISWSESDAGSVFLTVCYDIEEEKDYVDYLVEQLKKIDEKIQIEVSEEIVEYDADIFNNQVQHTKLYRHYTEQMKISRVGYVQETTVASAVVFSGVLGMILSVAIVVSKFINSKQLVKEGKN